jgi:phosphoglycerate dehydrogenase-like enzyme
MTTILLWLDEAETYRRAAEAAGLAGRCTLVALPRNATPDASLLASADAMLAWGAPAGLLAQMPKLRWLQALTAGVEMWLDRPDLSDRFALCCARGTHKVAMPENILAALFHITKPYTHAVLAQREHKWARKVGIPLAGKTLGILGLGAIGAELAVKANALGMRVVGTKRRPEPLPGVAKVVGQEQTAEILAESDFVVLLLPVTTATENSVNAGFLAQMKPGAVLINVSRAGIVDRDALLEALRSGRLGGFALDPLYEEPGHSDDELLQFDNVMLTPHTAAQPRFNALNDFRDLLAGLQKALA